MPHGLTRALDTHSRWGGTATSLVSSVQIQVLSLFYSKIVIRLNDFENYQTETAYEDNLIFKTFLFQVQSHHDTAPGIPVTRSVSRVQRPVIQACPHRLILLVLAMPTRRDLPRSMAVVYRAAFLSLWFVAVPGPGFPKRWVPRQKHGNLC